MPVNARKMTDLKDDTLSKIDDKFSEFKFDISAELKQQLKTENAEAFKKKKKIEEKGRVRVNSFSSSTRCYDLPEPNKRDAAGK